MTIEVEIQCINKSNRMDPYARIRNVGGVQNGQRWKMTEDEAIQAIRAGRRSFWTKGGGKIAKVVIATHDGHPYLKTEADGVHPNNLLALPECP